MRITGKKWLLAKIGISLGILMIFYALIGGVIDIFDDDDFNTVWWLQCLLSGVGLIMGIYSAFGLFNRLDKGLHIGGASERSVQVSEEGVVDTPDDGGGSSPSANCAATGEAEGK